MSMRNVILDLCGGTGSWSKPWEEAGYRVYNITLPDYDILETRYINSKSEGLEFNGAKTLFVSYSSIYGILAAPPCTMFSFARTNAKTPRNLEEGMACVRECLNIIWNCMEVTQDTKKKTVPLNFWALENPYHGLLRKFLGKPAFTFDPWEFGDGYQKRTALWGNFIEPKKNPIPMTREAKAKAKTNSTLHTLGVKFDYLKSKDIHPEKFGVFDRQTRRSITPAGFAQAFYEANN